MFSSFEFSGNVVGILIKADLDQGVYKEMKNLLQEKFTEYSQINLFIEVEKGHQISAQALVEHFKFSLEHSAKFNKIAVVTDKAWLKNMMILKDLLISAEVETFSHERRVEAVQWIAG